MISINDLVKELIGKGYKIRPRTIKYYIEQGLMPEPKKQGGYREGVRLVFPDKEEALARLVKIFELKGRGFKLSEIDKFLKDQKREKAPSKHKEYLKSFIEVGGRFYQILKREPDGESQKYADSLKDILTDLEDKKDADEVEGQGFFITPYMYQNRVVYHLDMLIEPLSWIELRRKYGIKWHILQALFEKHKKNFDRDVHWPDPDGVRFSEAWIGYHRQWALNFFGSHLVEYIKGIHEGFLDEWGDDDSFILDFKYRNMDIFIKDFLSGKCAFVPPPYGGRDDQGFTPFGGPALFLKKFQS